ncbi:MAG: hypothetical protein ACPHVK_01810 [Akkermansiaceae bacterium]
MPISRTFSNAYSQSTRQLIIRAKSRAFNHQVSIKKFIHLRSRTTWATFFSWCAVVLAGVFLASCSDGRKASASQPKQGKEKLAQPKKAANSAENPEQQDREKKSSLALLGQLHKDTVLRQVRLPRYDENFNPLSLLTAKTMNVIDGNRIEASDVSLELYDKDGVVKARTKVNRAIYTEHDTILRAEEAIYMSGDKFKVSGSGMIYEINTGQAFITGPGSSSFQLSP